MIPMPARADTCCSASRDSHGGPMPPTNDLIIAGKFESIFKRCNKRNLNGENRRRRFMPR
jgi:hypothetical protein